MPRFGPAYFDDVPVIRLRDPLAELLGVLEPGSLLDFSYADCVRLAGHSCLAVAGAYGLAMRTLPLLFDDETPVRGQLEVIALGAPEELAFGPMAMILGAIAGAEGEAGFGGLRGQHRRRGLLRFEPHRFTPNAFELRRLDGRRSVIGSFHPDKLTVAGPSPLVLANLLAGEATADEHGEFVAGWSEMVREALLAPPEGVYRVR